MSVGSSVQPSIKPHGVDPDDSGDDWEIGVGNLIIDLDADLEKERQRSEMNRVSSVKSGAAEGRVELECSCAGAADAFDGPTRAGEPQQGYLCKELKKFKLKRRNSSNDTDRSPSLEIPKVCVGKRREAQGRPGEAPEMSSAPPAVDSSGDATKAKDGKRGKNQGKGLKREKESVRTRKEKLADELGSHSENGCAVGGTENLLGRGGMDAAIVGRTDDTNTQEHELKTVRSNLPFYSRLF